MKVNVKADGTVELDVSNGEGQAALDLINALQANARQKQYQAEIDEAISQQMSPHLNSKQRETLKVLRALDDVEGVHVSAIAEYLEISTEAASQRLGVLVKSGDVHRVGRGYYRSMT